ncbi:hypothetical protein KSS87_018523 [Heliosperma pusillum]|nr:hypothetical protein KSS87_018523 [Heliosperma pusillum]
MMVLQYSPISTINITTITKSPSHFRTKMSITANVASPSKVIDSHLHVWASPQECMEEAAVDGALIVQPINHKFDHSYVTSVLKRYPSKFSGCCLANPAQDGSGLQLLQELVNNDGYCAVRFNPYLWPPPQKFATINSADDKSHREGYVLKYQWDSCVSSTEEENSAFLNLLELSKFPQVHVKLSALFRVSRESFPYQDISSSVSQLVSSYGASRIMWGSDFPFVVPECGYEAAKNAASEIAKAANLSPLELEWILGGTVMKLFPGHWASSLS